VQEKWQQALDNQRQSDAVLNQHGNHLMGYATHLGPICMTKRATSQSSLDRQKAEELTNQIVDRLSWAYVQIRKRTVEPSELSQYIENLQMIERRVQKVRSWLETTDSANYASVEQALNQAMQQFQSADRLLPAGLRGGSIASGTTIGSGGNASWSGKTAYVRGANDQIIGSSSITLKGNGLHIVNSLIFNGNTSTTDTIDVPFSQIAQCDAGAGIGGAFSAGLSFRTSVATQTSYSGGLAPSSSQIYSESLRFESQADMQDFVNYVNQRIGR
jgi:hypothetical protein